MKKIHLLGLAVLSGLLLSISWPANGFVPLIFVAFVPLFFIQDKLGSAPEKKRGGALFAYAYLTFVVWNALTTWWIWNSTGIGALAAIGLNSLFMSTVFWMFHQTKRKLYDNKKGWIILVFFWLTWEYFHLDWDLSWPWLNLGNVFGARHMWIQWYEYTGTAGGTIWVLVSNIVVFHLVKQFSGWQANRRKISMMLAALAVLWLAPIGISILIYNRVVESGATAEIVVVQPNFDPYSEQYELPPAQIIDRNLNLALSVMNRKTDFIVSPESAIQEAIWEERMEQSEGIRQLRGFLKNHPEITLVIGASTFSNVPAGLEDHPAVRKYSNFNGYYFAYNTAFYLDTTNRIQHYHKSKLTPGVEMMPSWSILKPLRNFAIDLGGTVGTLKVDEERKVFIHKDGVFKIAPVICYESIYGEFVAKFVRNGANMIFVITNDGWWGDSPGHRQHFLFSVLRAIETRRSIARSANTGISAFIDQRGDVFQETPYWEQAVIRQPLTTNDRITFYVEYGDYLSRIASFVAAIFFIYGFTRGLLKKMKSAI